MRKLWRWRTADEIQRWKQLGALPKWMDGREKTVRQKKAVLPVDSIEQLAKLEEQWCAQATQWVPPQNAVVRPLAEGRLFFLVFFSGHRRDGDLIQYLEWTDALITPIPIDLAIDGTWGNALDCNLWAELIVARKVLGCHWPTLRNLFRCKVVGNGGGSSTTPT